jgi:hypothetical protein
MVKFITVKNICLNMVVFTMLISVTLYYLFGLKANLFCQQEMMPVDNLMLASRYFFQKIGGCEITFGLLDLVDPKPIRIRKFLSSLVNFWLFCNNQYNATNEVKKVVCYK